jgi:hypothetical protein
MKNTLAASAIAGRVQFQAEEDNRAYPADDAAGFINWHALHVA